jgi:hypothetical protein
MSDMTEQYEYYVEIQCDESLEHPGPMWRKSDSGWDYLSLLDWEWHSLAANKKVSQPPAAKTLVPISGQQADELTRDRQRFVKYWAYYSVVPEKRDKPLTVLRRRSSPELVLDEAFGRDGQWVKTPSIVEFEHPYFDSPELEEIDAETAERILREVRGVSGATEL